MGRGWAGARAVLGNVPLPPGQVAGLAADVLLERLRPVPLPGPRVLGVAAGAGLMAAGCAINVRALAERRRREGGAFELDRPRRLVVTGPYAASRNPMYAGWWLLHLGAGLLRGSAWALLTTPAAALVEHRAVLAEERELAELFGADFAAYAGQVPRYVPLRRLLPWPSGKPRA